jgi:putative transposase
MMKRIKITETQIVQLLKQHEQGVKVADICRDHGISGPTFYRWKAQYGGMEASELKRMRELEEENARLKKMYAELSLLHHAFKDAVEKKL